MVLPTVWLCEGCGISAVTVIIPFTLLLPIEIEIESRKAEAQKIKTKRA